MKKTLLAVAALAAFSSSVYADVTVYGKVDLGFLYDSVRTTNNDGSKVSASSFKMNSGLRGGSRIGFKGVEDLGNGTKVNFVLEGGFAADNGEISDDMLFSRQASLGLETDFGGVTFGRMAALNAGLGTTDVYRYATDVLDGGNDINTGAAPFLDRGIYNNMVSYVSPTVAGVTAYGQYSLGTEADANGARDNDRYAAVGAKYNVGALEMMAMVDTILRKEFGTDVGVKEDALGVSVGGNYNFGHCQVFVAAQYGKNETKFANVAASAGNVADGFMVNVGAQGDFMGGTLQTALFYAKADVEEAATGADKGDIKRYGATIGQNYYLSKRTSVGAALGYNIANDDKEADIKTFEAGISLQHNF